MNNNFFIFICFSIGLLISINQIASMRPMLKIYRKKPTEKLKKINEDNGLHDGEKVIDKDPVWGYGGTQFPFDEWNPETNRITFAQEE